MLKRFIEDPVLSTVISILIVILGIIGVVTLPITQYPDIAPPTVRVTASYPGANAETVLRTVVIPLEEKINGVEGMTYMTSTASNNGMASINVFFEQDYDPDIAAVNVQNSVALANSVLPPEVLQTGISTKKQQTSALMYLDFYSSNPEYKEDFIANYLNINIIPVLQRIHGIGEVGIYSSNTYAMRIWLKPDRMAAYGLEPQDVARAINAQSREASAGVLGESSGEAFSYTIRYSGRLEKAEEYKKVVIKALGGGDYLRLEDVADVELGVQNYAVASHTKGFPSISLSIFQTKGSNAREIIQEIHRNLAEFKKDLPEGMDVFINYDTNDFLEASISKVVRTLIEAFILVFLVVFIFLQDFRSTLIPAIAVPVSIIGTFFFLNLFGYSINLLTLFALVLAIGIVVDDAIVVVEVVHAELDKGAQDVKKATIKAMDEIVGAIISITLIMAAVFLPVTFIPGPPGVFFKQFGITLMTAIIISAVNALTLSPALCALFLKPVKHEEGKKNFYQRFNRGFNRAFNSTVERYGRALHFVHKFKWITPMAILLSAVGIWWISTQISTGFVPSEDRGTIIANVELPAGSSIDRTQAVLDELREKGMQIPGIEDMSLTSGWSVLSGQGNNMALGYIKLAHLDKRKDPDLSLDAIRGKLFGVAATIKDAQIIFFSPPSVPGYGASGGFEVNLQDKFGGSFDELSEINSEFVEKLNQRPEIQYAQSSFRTDYPQYKLDIDVPRTLEAGVDINSIFSTLQGYIGGMYLADFSRFGKQYRIYLQALPEDRIKLSDIDKMYVRSGDGSMAPITQFISLSRIYGPQSVTRFNMFNSTKVTGASNPGYSSGDAITAIEEVATELPGNYGIDYSGLTRDEVKATGQTYMIFILVIVFVYFLLAAQYKSYLLPFSILLSVPIGIFGAYLFTMLFGLENNIYFQIALIMLVGLLAKNAILIVEFGVQRRRLGESILDSAIDGAKARLRPILMTSFAFVFGLMPLVLAQGVGAIGNRSIGTGAVFGLLVGTVFGIFVIPTLYVFFQWLHEKIAGTPEFITEDGDLED